MQVAISYLLLNFSQAISNHVTMDLGQLQSVLLNQNTHSAKTSKNNPKQAKTSQDEN